MSLAQTVYLEQLIFCISYYVVYKRPETAATCRNKQFRQKIHLPFLPICQEEINVIFVWVYELENNSEMFWGWPYIYEFWFFHHSVEKLAKKMNNLYEYQDFVKCVSIAERAIINL